MFHFKWYFLPVCLAHFLWNYLGIAANDVESTLVWVIPWCRQASSHYWSQCCPSSVWPFGITRPQWFNSLTPGRCSCIFKFVIFKLISMIYHEHFLWNCPQMNFRRPPWWLVNIGSGNGLVPPGNKPLPEPLLTQVYGITRPQCLMSKHVFFSNQGDIHGDYSYGKVFL